MDPALEALSRRVGEALLATGDVLVTAESCTGGWIGEVVTMVSGSSRWYDRGFITYSNAAKEAVLGVPAETLARHGAVSEPTVIAMVDGALIASGASLAVAVSGVAGPTGGSAEKPVGTVCLAWGRDDGTRRSVTVLFPGDREAVRRATVVRALEGIVDLAGEARSA